MLPRKEKKKKKEVEPADEESKMKFAERLRAMLNHSSSTAAVTEEKVKSPVDPYEFPGCERKSPTFASPRTNVELSPIGQLLQNARVPQNSVAAPAVLNQPAEVPGSWQPFSELMQRLEKNSRNKTDKKSQGKANTSLPSTAKTMNRLQSKIAQNKLLDKLRKNKEGGNVLGSADTSPSSSLQGEPSPLGGHMKNTPDYSTLQHDSPSNVFGKSEDLFSSQMSLGAFGEGLGVDLSTEELSKLSTTELCKLGLGAAELHKLGLGTSNYNRGSNFWPVNGSVMHSGSSILPSLLAPHLVTPPPPYSAFQPPPPPPPYSAHCAPNAQVQNHCKSRVKSFSKHKLSKDVTRQPSQSAVGDSCKSKAGSIRVKPRWKSHEKYEKRYMYQDHPLLGLLYKLNRESEQPIKSLLKTGNFAYAFKSC